MESCRAVSHEGWEVTSRPSNYNVAGTGTTARLYHSPNVWTRVNVVHADRNTPGFMRAPPETPYLFALESAMDELAVALKMDPIELRRINDAQKGNRSKACLTPADPWSNASTPARRRLAGSGAMQDPVRCAKAIGRLGGGALRAAYHASIGGSSGARQCCGPRPRPGPDRSARHRHRRLHRDCHDGGRPAWRCCGPGDR